MRDDTDTYADVKRLLGETASEAPAFAPAPDHAIRRARRRVAANVATAGVVTIALIVGAVAIGMRTLPDRAVPVTITDCTERADTAPTVGILDLATCELTEVSGLPELTVPQIFALSPDGTTLALEGVDDEGTPQIFTIGIDGTNLKQITNDPLEAFGPAWSPGGSQIVYTGFGNTTQRDLYVLDLRSESTERLTDDPNLEEGLPDWSPDGLSIVFGDLETGLDAGLYEIDVSSRSITRISRGTDLFPRYAPDGASLAFQRGHLAADIWVSEPDGSRPRLLLGTDLSEEFVDWSPDGTRLLYSEIAPDHSYADVYAVELATGERQLVLENVLKAVWLPDGRRIAIVSA